MVLHFFLRLFQNSRKKIGFVLFLLLLGMGFGCKKKHKEELNVIPVNPALVAVSPSPVPVVPPALVETAPSVETQISAPVPPETLPESQAETQPRVLLGTETLTSAESLPSGARAESQTMPPTFNDSAESLPAASDPSKGSVPSVPAAQSPASW